MNVFQRLSGHRLLEELKLLLGERETGQAVKRMADFRLLRCIHPKLAWSARLQTVLTSATEAIDWYRLLYLDRTIDVWLVYMIALLDVLPKRAVGEVLRRFPFSQGEAQKIRTASTGSHAIMRRLARRPPPTPAETYRILNGLSDETLLGLMAKSKGEPVKRQISAFFTAYKHVKPVLTGADLKAMRLKPGPQYKKILDQLLNARLNGEVKTEQEERALVERVAVPLRVGPSVQRNNAG